MINIFCQYCEKSFKGFKSAKRKFCSQFCYGKSRVGIKKHPFSQATLVKMRRAKEGLFIGKNNPNWKGGKHSDGQGYMLIYSPNHPHPTSNKHVYEHRLIMEKHIGRFLAHDEQIHHLNGIKNDNRIENLRLTNIREHPSIHKLERIVSGKKECTKCKKVFNLTEFSYSKKHDRYASWCKKCVMNLYYTKYKISRLRVGDRTLL